MNEFPDNWPDIAWDKLPVELRKRAVARLQWAYPPSYLADVRKHIENFQRTAKATDHPHNWMPSFWHHDEGMTMRNILRSDHLLNKWGPGEWSQGDMPPAIPDSELPGLPEIYGGADYGGNWDDYYIQALEAAAGLRKVEE